MGLLDLFRQKNDFEKLFQISSEGIVRIQRSYKSLPDNGKFEVLILNTLIVLRVYYNNHPANYSFVEEEYYKLFFNQIKKYHLPFNSDQIFDFVNDRLVFYSEELELIFNSGNNYIPGKVYSVFYITPLKECPDFFQDLFEMMRFIPNFAQMIYDIDKEANKL